MARGFGSRARVDALPAGGPCRTTRAGSSAGGRRGEAGQGEQGGRTVGSSHDLHHDRPAHAVPARRTGFHAAIPCAAERALGPGQPLTHQVIEFTRRQLSNGKRAGGAHGVRGDPIPPTRC